MLTVILAGGYGTRLAEETEIKPKPMVEIGGRPILWHILRIYAHYGHKEFAVALGYRGAVIKRYFLDYLDTRDDLTVDLAAGSVKRHSVDSADWKVHLVDTGLHTITGGRLLRMRRFLPDATFMMTYGDGLSNVDVSALVDFHRSHGKLATVTAVRPPGRFGAIEFSGNGDRVSRFTEKPSSGEAWISGGFFVLEPGVLDYISGDDTNFEREPLARMADEGELMAFRHDDFWHPMDTLRDVRNLNALWDAGRAPWKVWD